MAFATPETIKTNTPGATLQILRRLSQACGTGPRTETGEGLLPSPGSRWVAWTRPDLEGRANPWAPSPAPHSASGTLPPSLARSRPKFSLTSSFGLFSCQAETPRSPSCRQHAAPVAEYHYPARRGLGAALRLHHRQRESRWAGQEAHQRPPRAWASPRAAWGQSRWASTSADWLLFVDVEVSSLWAFGVSS